MSRLALCELLLFFSSWPALRAQQPQAQQGHAQQKPLSSLERGRTESMLAQMHSELKKSYYDPKFHGVDVDARYKEFQQRLGKAPTLGEAYRTVAAYLAGLNDPHTYFDPPQRSYRFSYGYRMNLIGDRCFITEIQPGSDAEKKLHRGDQVVSLGKFSINRK